MKTKTFHCLLFIITIPLMPLFSQPVLTQNGILPIPGDSITYMKGVDPISITNIQGPDVTWNFEYDTTVLTPSYIVKKEPYLTPYPSYFPLASSCEIEYLNTSLVGQYSYQTVNDGLWEEIGIIIPGSSGTSYIHYQDYNTIFDFPVQSGDSLMDYFSGYRIDPGNDTIPRHGKRYYKADGYGTLIYSTGDTFTDVMSLYSVRHVIDSMITYYDSTTIIDRMWYKDGVRTPLIIQRFTARYQYDYDLQIWTAVFSSNYRCLDPTYINGLISGEKEIVVAGSETINIYPNPFKGKFKISGITKGKNTISIHSVTGKCVYTAEIYNTEIEINLSQLPAGIYIYQMYSDTKMLKSGKLIKN